MTVNIYSIDSHFCLATSRAVQFDASEPSTFDRPILIIRLIFFLDLRNEKAWIFVSNSEFGIFD